MSTFTLDEVVPWGRSLDEYRRMFALTAKDLASRIVGCGDGPASFNAELAELGRRVVSCDPLYQFDAEAIQGRIAVTYAQVLEQTRRNRDSFVWDRIADVEQLGKVRMAAMNTFLADYPAGLRDGRYLNASLPNLPLADRSFDLAVCSHLLFLYSEQLSADFHCRATLEMLRVASEVRIFPLLTLAGQRSKYVQVVQAAVAECGYETRIERVDYEFQRGGNEMLRITRELTLFT